MGKVIQKKIQGMSLWAKFSLVTTLTLLVSVFMYQGWYHPKKVQAATVTYGVTVPSTASTGVDGAAQMPATGTITTAPTVRGNMSTTYTTSGSSYRPTTGMTNGTPVTLLKLYSPAYATAQTITAPSGSFAIRGYNPTDTWTFHIYSHNPAGVAGNKTLMYSSNTITSGTGATVAVTPTYTLVNSSMPASYKLLVEVVYTPGGTTLTPRVYLDGTTNAAWSRVTVTETASAQPTITGVTPNNLTQGASASSVTIAGTNLSGGTVSFSNPGVTGGTPTTSTATSIVLPVSVAANATTGAGTVTVTTAGGSANSAFTVNAAPAPTVTSTSPSSLTQGTGPSTVTINGTNFLPGSTVAFSVSGTPLTLGTVTYVSATQLTVPVTVPAGATAGTRNVTVTLPGGQAGTGTGVFTVSAAITSPTVSSASPSSQTQGTGPTTVTITGTGFQSGAVVAFSGTGVTAGASTFVSSTSLTVPVTVAPGATTGARTITVTNPDTGSGAGGSFTVNAAPAPTVTSTTPNSMAQGTGPTTVTINGTNFLSGATVVFSGTGVTAGAATYVSATQLTVPVTVDAGATTGARNVTVTLPGGQTGTGTGVFTVTTGASCTVGARTMTITPNIFVIPGGVATYTVTVSNGDTGASCANLPVTLTRGTPTNTTDFVTSALSKTSLSVPPGGTDSATFTATANAGAANGVTSSTTVTSSVTTTTPNSVTATTTVTLFSSPLMHNSANTSTKYGVWGTGYTCDTCHNRTTTNVKRIDQLVDTPKGPRTVVFTRMTAARTNNAATGVFGNDNRTYALNASTNICEVCHHNTTYHQYSSSKILAGNKNHQSANNMDCTGCHSHSAGFKGAGHLFPYVGSTHMASAGTTPWSTCSTGGCHNTTATGVTYATWATTLRGTAPNCTTCHIAGLLVPVGTSSCWDCHGSSATDGRPAGTTFPNVAGAHNSAGHVNFVCATCHNGAGTGTATHGNSNGVTKTEADVIVAFSTAGTWSFAAKTCSAIYCHSTVQSANGTAAGVTETTPAWAAGTITCATNCHGNTSARLTTGSHSKHLDTNHATYGCTDCHIGAGSGTSLHGDSQINVSINTFFGGTYADPNGAPANGFTTCSTVYCHSSAQAANGGAGAPVYKTPSWGGPVLACNGCHGNTTTDLLTGSHSKHLDTNHATIGCVNCHSGFELGNNAAHVNKVVNVQQNLLVGSTGTYTDAAGTPGNGFGSCSASYCHSTVQSATGTAAGITYRTPTWGGAAMTCTSCHGNDSGTLTTGSHTTHLNSAYLCTACHGATGGLGNTAVHVNQLINVDVTVGGGAAATYNGTAAPQDGFGSCNNTVCHGIGSSVVWGANTATTQCEKCHGSAATSAAGTFKNLSGNTTAMRSVIHVSHLASTHNFSGDVACSACHVVPASPIAANHLDTGKPADVIAAAGYTAATKSCSTSCHGVGLPASNPARTNPTWNATILTGGVSTLGDGVSGGTNPGSGDCSKCHGYPPQNNHAVTNCSTCHTHMSSNSAFSNPSLHINGNVDFVSGCDGCHDYDTVGAAFAAGVWSGGSWGKNPQDGLTPNEGFGAHAKHINHIKTRLGYTAGLNTSAVFGAAGSDPARVCGTCHTNTVGNHTTAGGVPAGRSINFGDSAFVMGSTGGTSLLFGTTFPTQNPVYNGVPGTSKQTTAKTCSNISCHYFTTPNW